jgi:hypothetical protein
MQVQNEWNFLIFTAVETSMLVFWLWPHVDL